MQMNYAELIEVIESSGNQSFDFSHIFSAILGVIVAFAVIKYKVGISSNLEKLDLLNELIVNVYKNSRKLEAYKNRYIHRLTKSPLERMLVLPLQINIPKKIDYDVSKISYIFVQTDSCPELLKMTDWVRLDRIIGMIENYNTLIDVLTFKDKVHYKIASDEKFNEKLKNSTDIHSDLIELLGEKEAADYLLSTEDVIEGVDFIIYEFESFLSHVEYLAEYNIDLGLIKKYRKVIGIGRTNEEFAKITRDSLKVSYDSLAKLVSLDRNYVKNRVQSYKKRIPTLSDKFSSIDEYQKKIINYKFKCSVKNKFRFSFL
ncbi:hypothetical protein QWI17_01710 [Gilvimarinus sp. SDUM040013]|uniref:Uncharacterized protein n=1 Tax=Gilvimarinus gilvus TaxID=3058038 RepID=A0ABU4S477_9GAMM|nr:hypothetical protein [Gilvimarinus sp. SDUM040013]MDO3384546.1 hypothetical protein [Gilvimarinus sp. SDUM040013]MDX6850119.1 hypothetical protein [Gilvimarinus sp. SDUM040013]